MRLCLSALKATWMPARRTSLDEIDGEPDREDGGDSEPSLGTPRTTTPHRSCGCAAETGIWKNDLGTSSALAIWRKRGRAGAATAEPLPRIAKEGPGSGVLRGRASDGVAGSRRAATCGGGSADA
jgi:hypothetical protein